MYGHLSIQFYFCFAKSLLCWEGRWERGCCCNSKPNLWRKLRNNFLNLEIKMSTFCWKPEDQTVSITSLWFRVRCSCMTMYAPACLPLHSREMLEEQIRDGRSLNRVLSRGLPVLSVSVTVSCPDPKVPRRWCVPKRPIPWITCVVCWLQQL